MRFVENSYMDEEQVFELAGSKYCISTLSNGKLVVLQKMSEQKQTEGLNALEESKRLEATFKHKSEAIQQQLAELSIREHKLTKEKFEIQREKELIEKRKEKLFAFLPDVENTIQPTIIDPRSIITRLRAEKDIEND
ncbi:uncharacterized protein LOC113466069 isoform X2 [Diaphorina citri]|uniref:Uncharacterized protein LOC113466069 isoform X2 n=1 Tax=Diaphorina citri TaxID=121845 RepID=A0A3Q0IRK2_DIACI|nr:uncharacterized protein LOC113466069 isoform X2 [Diaphorina citri]